ILGVAFSPDTSHVVAATAGEISLWKSDTGEFVKSIKPQDAMSCAGFSADRSRVAVGTKDRRIFLYTIADGNPEQTFTGHAGALSAIRFSPDGRHLISTDSGGTLRVAELKSGQMVEQFDGISMAGAAAFAPDNKTIV